jgi:hypothetical protein
MSSRITQDKAGSTFGFGLRGFIGAEYFIFPKMAVGAEFGWGIGMSNRGDGTIKTESLDVNLNEQIVSGKNGGKKQFGLDTDINSMQMMPTASLNLTLHF